MKDSLGDDMPGITRENIGEICYFLTNNCSRYITDDGGITFIPEEDPEQPPVVKLMVCSGVGTFAISLSEEQVFNALYSIRSLINYEEQQVIDAIDKFSGTEWVHNTPGKHVPIRPLSYFMPEENDRPDKKG